MALEDFLDSEVAVAVAATAALASPRVRGVLRRGAVYGLAGLPTAGGMISSFARGAPRGAQQTRAAAPPRGAEGTQPPPAERPREGRRPTRPTPGGAAQRAGGAAL